MTSVNEFIKNFKGGARNDRFRVIINYPAAIGGTPNKQDYLVVTTAALPGSTVTPANVFFQGRQIPILGDRQNEPWTMTVLNDTDFSHRNAFTRWLNQIMSHEGNVQGTANWRDLLGVIEVQQLDRDDTVLKIVKLYNAFPDNMSQVDLDYGSVDQVEIYSVTFAYSHWLDDQSN